MQIQALTLYYSGIETCRMLKLDESTSVLESRVDLGDLDGHILGNGIPDQSDRIHHSE